MRKLLWTICLLFLLPLALASAQDAKDRTIVITVADQQGLFNFGGAFDDCLKLGGQRCVVIQDWLKAKIAKGTDAAPPKPEDPPK